MPRPRYRACLESGLKLDLNRLRRRGYVTPGHRTGPKFIRWSWTQTDEEVASGTLEAQMTNPEEGWLRIRLGELDQWLSLVSQPRKFGGHQWYFECPVTRRRASVLWMPPGARRFASRQAWRRQVAYASQFETRYGRALLMAQRIRTKLAGPEWAGLDGNDPPKQKWMRWATYNRMLDRCDRYESVADERLFMLAAKLMRAGG